MGLLFRYVQYIERQVVLVDALEDARYDRLNDLEGAESLAGILPRTPARDWTRPRTPSVASTSAWC